MDELAAGIKRGLLVPATALQTLILITLRLHPEGLDIYELSETIGRPARNRKPIQRLSHYLEAKGLVYRVKKGRAWIYRRTHGS